MLRAMAEGLATIGLMLALFALFGVVIVVTDRAAEFHKRGLARVRRYEQRERAKND
jgi:hypothetical protein